MSARELYKHKYNELLKDIEEARGKIVLYECDCRLSISKKECEQCATNVFGSIYQILDNIGKDKGGE